MSKIGDAGMSDFETVPIGTKAKIERLTAIETAALVVVKCEFHTIDASKHPEEALALLTLAGALKHE